MAWMLLRPASSMAAAEACTALALAPVLDSAMPSMDWSAVQHIATGFAWCPHCMMNNDLADHTSSQLLLLFDFALECCS